MRRGGQVAVGPLVFLPRGPCAATRTPPEIFCGGKNNSAIRASFCLNPELTDRPVPIWRMLHL
ncbi:hypothetical protein SBA5_760021 [Candidatus Sulfotelmatomonas gaucii]|uniref:Uncharacterized protein n=1 Tax=Candidatus Sulfuritelmatomonas gaucii TaxID=2043161 RepID=A0A2N9M3Z9_9BACT|nr:hypothetical protein SBA5_760021 [Candidatus Sulfotelmatomonas gaucii]